MFYSSIKPSTIVFGKILSGIIITFILMSITMPFVALAYSLRGIDLIIILEIMIQIFMLIQVLNSIAIFVASSNKFKFSTYLSSLVAGGVSFLVYLGVIELTLEVICITDTSIKEVFYFLLYFESVFLAIFISSSTVTLSASTSNRMFAFRILLTAIFVISFLGACSGIFWKPIDEACAAVAGFSLMFAPFLILAAVCEPDQWSTRIRQHLPKSLIYRAILFPFCTGSPCGIVWIFLMMAAILGVDKVFVVKTIFSYSIIFFWLGIIIFTFNYSVTAMLIRSWCFKKLDTKYVPIIALVLLLTFTVGSMLLHLILISSLDFTEYNPFIGYSVGPLSALNPFCAFENWQFKEQDLNGMLIWFVLLMILLIGWYSKRLVHFNSNIEEPMTCEEARKFIQNIENS
jgi:hypothetical protein